MSDNVILRPAPGVTVPDELIGLVVDFNRLTPHQRELLEGWAASSTGLRESDPNDRYLSLPVFHLEPAWPYLIGTVRLPAGAFTLLSPKGMSVVTLYAWSDGAITWTETRK